VPDVLVPKEIDAESALRLRDDVREVLAGARAPVVLRGSPECFCAGVSLHAVAAGGGDPTAPVQAVADALEELIHARVPTVAVVEGPAVGGGVGLLAACDRVLATQGATFALPELLYGLVPLVILPALRRRMDLARWTWLALTGVARDAAEARALGLVDEVVSSEALAGRLQATERLLARVDPAALAATRAHVLPRAELHAELQRAVAATVARLTDPDVRNAMATYLRDGQPPWVTRR
jgi:enoyl-CoA hydratase/carnithine racemase